MTGWIAENRDYLLFVASCLLASAGLAWWLARTRRLHHVPILVWAGIAAVLLGGWLLVRQAGRATQADIRQRIEQLLPVYAQELQRLGHARVATHSAPDNPTYLHLIETELLWQKWNPFIADIYTLRRSASDDRLLIVVDAETDYDHNNRFEGPREQRTAPGTFDVPLSPARQRALNGETLLVDEVYTDSWGTWVSAYTPLRDEDGQVEAVLGVDLDSKLWLSEAARARLPWILALAVVVALLAGGGIVVAVLREKLAQRRQAERKLNDESEVIRLAFEHAPSGMAMAALDGAYLAANPAYCRMLGYTHEELMQKKTHEVSLPEDLPAERAAIAELIAGRTQLLSLQKRYRRKDGTVVHTLLNTCLARDENGRALYYVGHIIDLTAMRETERERRQFERKLLEAQKLESLGVLAGGVARDFNNLLTTILGNATLARLSLGSDSGSTPRGHLEHIEQASKAAAALCQQLLAYSGHGPLEPHPLDLGALMREIGDLLRLSVGKNARLQLQSDPDLPAILADPVQIRQVLLNLVLNATEALGERGGEIRLAARRGAFSREWLADARVGQELPAGDYVCLEVADDGPGMTDATLARIFDPFFTTKATGRGLGLAAVLGIVRSHHGALKVGSSVGQGTVFTLLFRPHQAAAQAPGGGTGEEWRGAGQVLIVDDETAVRETTAMMISVFGFTAHPVDSGEEAIAHVQAGHPVDLVLLDLTMPGMDGFTTFARLRELRPDLRIVIFSGYSEQDVRKRFTGTLLNGFLQKPFTADALQRAVRAALAS